MRKDNKKNHEKIIILIIIVTLIIDQVTKIIAYKQGFNILSESSNNNGYYIVMSIIIILLILRYIRNDNVFIKLDTKIVLSFAISGAVGNLIDRIWNNDVITFIKLGNYFNLNLS